MDRKVINEALFLARVYWGFSQVDMAKELGISQSSLSEIEASKRTVDMDLLRKYSTVLKVPMSTFVIFSEDLEGRPPARKNRYVVADWALKTLERLVPDDRLEKERQAQSTLL